ncbi:Hypothetical predicted protein [Mytilus galloprovincialis]|uniref:CCHC-type domain-containing protein n=1 Tax=Mytilus galloprovincialis TaxID=29158 RepID=A0A8B6GJ90_MYTGA|nr:Hypothetical predicted protein [Mytilus galloprovincialis]
MRSGNLLVECSNKSQSTNLLTMSTISNFPVSASPHNSLNSCKGIIRDRSQYLGDLTVEEIGEELSSQGVTNVIRFQIKKNGNIIKLNTYLLTFRTPTPPPSITLGCFGIRVDMFIPNPIRCFTCQKFGHGSKQCRGKQRCFKCSDEGHEGTNCHSESSKCVNCGESHFSSSRDCPVYLKEKKILLKLKQKETFSYPEAKQIASVSNDLLVSNRPSYASKVVRSFSHENTQTRMTWPIDADNFKMLPVETEPTDKILIPRKPKSSKTKTVEIHNWSGESVWDLPSDIDDSSTSKKSSFICIQEGYLLRPVQSLPRAPSPLRSPEKKDVQKKPGNTSSQKSSDSRSRGRGRGGVKPAARVVLEIDDSPRTTDFQHLSIETEMEIESVPPPERSRSQGERNKNAGKLDSIRPSFIK